MKRLLPAALALFFVLAAAPAPAQAQTFLSVLTGDQEVPPVDTNHFGVSVLFFLNSETLVSFRVTTLTEAQITGAHIHLGPPGEDGPIVIDFRNASHVEIAGLAFYVNTAEDLEGPLAESPLSALRDAMLAGNTYINLHTEANPGGEIRGQIQPLRPVVTSTRSRR